MERRLTLLAVLACRRISQLKWVRHPILKNLFNFVFLFERTPPEVRESCQLEFIECRSKLNLLCNRIEI